MRIAPDKIAHAKAGAKAGAFGAIVTIAAAFICAALGPQLVQYGAAPFNAVLCSFVAGTACEFTQRNTNAVLAAQGMPALHAVEWRDILATSAPGPVIGAITWAGLHFLKLL